jgi:hypothetical protein
VFDLYLPEKITHNRILLGVADFDACIDALAESSQLFVLEYEDDFLLASLFVVPWSKFKGQLYFSQNYTQLETFIIKCFQERNINLTDIFLDNRYYEAKLRESYQALLELIQSSNGKANYFEKQLLSFNNLNANQLTGRYLLETEQQIGFPVVIIGNGPSLDKHLTSLKNLRKEYLLISCGTALITLHKNGLLPDFHLELERGAETLFYLEQLPASFLSQIPLISPADQHPDVVKLFRDALFTILAQNELTERFAKRSEFPLRQLHYSYYTVTNFAVDLFLTIGGQDLYLIGVDFGFKNIRAHHASDSVYFKDNRELYDFELTHGSAYEVPANFGGQCLTVPPFDVARRLMARRILLAVGQKVYNCNDGARIDGTIPLKTLEFTIAKKLGINYAAIIDNLFTSFKLPALYQEADVIQPQLKSQLEKLYQSLPQNSSENQQRIFNVQRQLLESGNLPSQILLCTLLDGSLRYVEMVSARLQHFPNCFSLNWSLVCLWKKYLAQLIQTLK